MGPIGPPDANDNRKRKQAIRWIDDEKDIKSKLETNKSSEDLVHKDPEKIDKVMNHRDASKLVGLKSSIKPFVLDKNSLTGLQNFTEIAKNPLQIPEHGKPTVTAAP